MKVNEDLFLQVWQRHYLYDDGRAAADVQRFRRFLADYLDKIEPPLISREQAISLTIKAEIGKITDAEREQLRRWAMAYLE